MSGEVLVSGLASQGWYSSDHDVLTRELDGYISKVTEERLKGVQALILPHAGYRYSGQTTAYGIKQIIGNSYSRVIIIGPSHRMPMMNKGSVPKVEQYKTPLGLVPLDLDFIEELLKTPFFESIPLVHEEEHSVQIQIPFLQKTIKDLRIVPIVFGKMESSKLKLVSDDIMDLMDENTLVIISSDFTHYGSAFGYLPFTQDIEENLRKLDLEGVGIIKTKDEKAFDEYIQSTGATICGNDPIRLLLRMLGPNTKSYLLHYTTSGDMTGDWSHTVSYISMAFTDCFK